MSYGLAVKGSQGNVIVDSDNPVLHALYSGDLVVNLLTPYQSLAPAQKLGWGMCQVNYPETYNYQSPPIVIGAPTGALANDISIGLFTHLGLPGAWTGFRIHYMGYIGRRGANGYATYGKGATIGLNTGWRYHVCTLEPFSSGVTWGMKVLSESQKVIYDSGWPIVPFRQLLKNWRHIATPLNPYTEPVYNPYIHECWYQRSFEGYKGDLVDELYEHDWGWPDGQLGIMLSSLSGLSQYVDYGSFERVTVAPFVGFIGSDRSRIICWMDFGIPQHKSATAGNALNNWGLLTADVRQV